MTDRTPATEDRTLLVLLVIFSYTLGVITTLAMLL